jgi:hypothetical protein
MWRLLILSLLLNFSLAAKADELPAKPVALIRVASAPAKPKVVDKEFIVDVSAMTLAWGLDGISTHRNFSHARYEIGPFFPGTQSTWKPELAWAGVDAAAVVLGYEWKKHVRNRYLKSLWRVPILDRAVEHTNSAIGNWRINLAN